MRTAQLQQEFGLTLRHTVFPLHPETPQDGGIELAEMFPAYDLTAMFARLQTVANEVALPLTERMRTYNSRRAQELGKWAEAEGKGEEFRGAIYHAYFAAGRDISRPEELVAIAVALGLPAEGAQQVLQERTCATAVDADWQRARELGVSAVPTLRYQKRHLVGFTPYATLRHFITG